MKIAIGSDHGGFALKQELRGHLDSAGHQVTDVGTSSNEAVDYPLFARKVAELVAGGLCERGIMIDGAGIGSAMVANKVPGIRAAMVYDLSTAQNSREHNDANVLTLGAGLTGPNLAWQIVELWLSVDCNEDRHLRRVAMIEGNESLGPRAAVPTGLVGAVTPAGPVVDPAGMDEADLRRILLELQPLLKGGGEPQLAGSIGASSGESVGAALAQTPAAGAMVGASTPKAGTTDVGMATQASAAAPDLSAANIASMIDHTLLKPDATAESIKQLCAEAREHGFASVCVNSVWVPLAASELRGSSVKTCSVVGFPLGAMPPEMKAMETRRAIREGAAEIDMVIDIGALKRGDQDLLLKDIRAVVEACRDGSALCKVIIETCLLDDDEKRLACRLARRARAQFVKTSTGFAGGGATAEDVALMAAEVRDAGMEVKAAGGIRNLDDVRRMVAAGATRIGASAGVAIVQEASAAER